ncbi:MAG: DUF4381 domain-containing protein [Planctomycetota bacterium]
MTSSDPYSLDRLVDITTPSPISSWPPAAGWWFVMMILTLWIGVLVIRAYRRRRGRAYRRQALMELGELRQGDFATLSILLKRVALISFPREQVASLVGPPWMEFLSASCPDFILDSASAERLCTGTTVSDVADCDSSSWSRTIDQCANWIRDHRSGALT